MPAVAIERAEVERCIAAGELARALQLSEALLAAQPDDAEVQTLRASALMAQGGWGGAAELLERALTSAAPPYAAKARLALCRVRLGDQAGALAAFRLALAERPADFVQRLGYAESLAAVGDADAALPEFFRAVHEAQAQGRWLSDASTPPHLRERVKLAMTLIDGGRKKLFFEALEPHVATFGPDALQRVAVALEVYLGLAPAPAGDPLQRPKFFHMAGLPPMPYFPRELFPWYEALEAATPDIQRELQAVLGGGDALTPFLGMDAANAPSDYLGGDPGSRAWDAYFFHRHGERFEEHLERCPRTAQALTHVPLTVVQGHAPEVLFSFLAADTHIKPHHGVTNTRVVTHLPLRIPAGDCRLVVGGVEHAWEEGRCVTFDDTFLHEAWNRTGELRVVMILDTWNPHLTEAEQVALKDLVERIGDFNARAAIR
jgi:aspartyl/asparaginyl beta-hydroxylase (cupin superfamily)